MGRSFHKVLVGGEVWIVGVIGYIPLDNYKRFLKISRTKRVEKADLNPTTVSC